MKRLILCLFFLPIAIARAQSPGELLEQWSARSPIEKVYLHFDRSNYVTGETAWFKAYMYSDFYPDTISTTLYVELMDQRGLVDRKVIPVVEGVARCQFELSDTLKTGMYSVRAYSPTMLNHGTDFLSTQQIYITGKEKTVSTTQGSSGLLKIALFPESGMFVNGLSNTIAFRITDSNNWPHDANGIVTDDQGNTIVTFNSYHDGMGSFDITPQPGRSYTAILHAGTTNEQKQPLPVAKEGGFVFRVTPFGSSRRLQVISQQRSDVQPAYILAQMQHHVLFKIKLPSDKPSFDYTIDTKKIPSGILQFTIFSKDDLPLAERLTFVDNKEYLQQASVVMDTLNFEALGRNKFTLSFIDSVKGHFSVSVTDPDFDAGIGQQEDIISNLLLRSDLRGYIHNPSYYFKADRDSARIAADNLMMVNGWRRFQWDSVKTLAKRTLPYEDPHFISVSGQIRQRDRKQVLADKSLFVMVSPLEDSLNNSMRFLVTDEQGRFRMDSMIFFGKTRFYFSDINGTKGKWLDIYPDADSLKAFYGLPVPKIPYSHAVINDEQLREKLETALDAIRKAQGEMLEAAIVKTKKKTPLEELEDRYTSGLFGGFAAKTIDLVHTDEKIFQNNIFDYLQSRVPGMNIRRNEGQSMSINTEAYTILYHNRANMSGPVPMKVYLDEMEVTTTIASTIPAEQIALIKVFSTFLGGNGDASGGVLALYTKKGADLNSSLLTGADIFNFKGYSITKEFYSPEYPTGTPPTHVDNRITLDWRPDVEVFGVAPSVPFVFYNNDRTGRFKIIIEGMTAEGKMVSLEKTITKKGF